MAVKEIELCRNCLHPVAHEHIGDPSGKVSSINGGFCKEQVTVLPKIVVHCRVEHITLEPMAGGFPDFADQQDIRLDFLDGFPEGSPEAIIHLAGNIQTPAINTKFLYPVASTLQK